MNKRSLMQAKRDRLEVALQRMEAKGLISRGTSGDLPSRERIKLPSGLSLSNLIRMDRDERGF